MHFDYEYPLSKNAWKEYNKFLVSLNEKLGDYTLGVACSDWNLKFSLPAIEAVDTFELMVYDFNDDKKASLKILKIDENGVIHELNISKNDLYSL